jgi:hypothetical protein
MDHLRRGAFDNMTALDIQEHIVEFQRSRPDLFSSNLSRARAKLKLATPDVVPTVGIGRVQFNLPPTPVGSLPAYASPRHPCRAPSSPFLVPPTHIGPRLVSANPVPSPQHHLNVSCTLLLLLFRKLWKR